MINRILFFLTLAGLGSASFESQADWPQFRGPKGNGISDAQGLPLTWSETENVKWKTPIHGKGWSSPVVLGNQVWVTTATERGHELSAICLDRESGKIIHDLKLFEVEEPPDITRFNTYASPTPVIEPGRIYVTFGSAGTACLDAETGKVLWERRDIECNHFRGAGSSPILFEDLLIMNFDGSDYQFVTALNKETGETVWRTDRTVDFDDLGVDGKPKMDGDERKAFATPQIAEIDGKPVLISVGAKATYAYDPYTGEEIWRVEERMNHSASSRPVVGHGMIFYTTGWAPGQLLAVRPGKKGEVIDANAEPGHTQLRLMWKVRRGVTRKPSLLLVDDLLYMVEDGSRMFSCIEAKTGEEVWHERGAGLGDYSASPVYAGGKIYFFNEAGKGTVLQAGREFAVLAENQIEGGLRASPAIAGNSLFVRTGSHLYRIGVR